jgi:hypothetical protein
MLLAEQVGELVRQLLEFSHYKLLLLEAGNCGWGQFGIPEKGRMSAIGSHYRATASEDCKRLRRPSVSYSDL